MSPIDTILVVVDPMAKHHAGLAKGALLAQKCQARVDLFAWSHSGPRGGHSASGSGAGSSADEIVRDAEVVSMLRALAQPLRERGLEVTTQAARGDSLSAVVVERLKPTCAKLVIKDVRQHATTQHASLTYGDWELLRSCPVALLLSKPTLWPERPQICAAIDPRSGSQERVSLDRIVMEQGAMLAKQLEGELHVLHAYIPPAFVVTVPAAEDFRALESSHQLALGQCHAKLRSLKTLASGYGLSANQVHVAIGPACDVLSSFVKELRASVVVMGAVSRSALRREVIGSTAEALIEQIPCDVLAVSAMDAAMSLH